MMDRGRVRRVEILDGRVLLDVTLDSGEIRTKVELMLPTGITAIPQPGADVVLARVGGRDSDLVALQADDGASRVTTAAGGDWAVRAHGATILVTAERISITHGAEIVVEAPVIKLGAGATKKVALDQDPVSSNRVQATATKVFAE